MLLAEAYCSARFIRSSRASTASAAAPACSGVMYSGVPTTPPKLVLPVPVGDGPRGPRRRAGFLDKEPAEPVQVGELGCRGVLPGGSGQEFVQCQDQIGILGQSADLIEQLERAASGTRRGES
jgi:hypothetical protein